MNEKLTLHSITIRHCKELERKFEIASECGYAGLDLEETDILRYIDQGHDNDDLARLSAVKMHLFFHRLREAVLSSRL